MTIGIIQVGPGIIIGDDDLMERTYGDGDGVPHMQESSVQEYLQYHEGEQQFYQALIWTVILACGLMHATPFHILLLLAIISFQMFYR